jgi:hypothetical protein
LLTATTSPCASLKIPDTSLRFLFRHQEQKPTLNLHRQTGFLSSLPTSLLFLAPPQQPRRLPFDGDGILNQRPRLTFFPLCKTPCPYNAELCSGTRKQTIKGDVVNETPRHNQRQLRFYTNLADKTNPNQTRKLSMAALAVCTNDLLLICKKIGDPHLAGRQLDPNRDRRYPQSYVVSRAGTPKKRAVSGLARSGLWDIADTLYP